MKFMRSKDTELPGKFLYPLHITVDTVCVYSLNPVKRFPSYHLYSLQVPHENALAVCPSDFGQPLRGEFHGFLPLLPTSQQLSVLRSSCTIPLQRFLFIETVYKLSCYHRVVKKNFCSRIFIRKEHKKSLLPLAITISKIRENEEKRFQDEDKVS